MTTKTLHIISIIFLIAVAGLGWYAYSLNKKVKQLTAQDPQHIVDTLVMTDVQFDTIYNTYHLVDTLEVVDTTFIVDTVANTVYIPVQVPMSHYVFDTSVVFETPDTLTVGIHGAITGHRATLDTLTVGFHRVWPAEPEKKKLCKLHIGPAVGVGYGTGGWGAFIGIGCVF